MQLRNALIFFLSCYTSLQNIDSVLPFSLKCMHRCQLTDCLNSPILTKSDPMWMIIPASHYAGIGKKQKQRT